MHRITLTLLALLCPLILYYGCLDETLSPAERAPTLRDPGDRPNNGNGNNNGPDKDIYSEDLVYGVAFGGIIASEQSVDAEVSKNNKKFTSVCPGVCVPIALTGIGDLVPCYQQASYSPVFHEIRQFNKIKLPDRVANHFWFHDPNVSPGTIKFTMVGSILGDEDQLLPSDFGEFVTIAFDKWTITDGSGGNDVPDACLETDAIPFPPENQPMLTFWIIGPECL